MKRVGSFPAFAMVVVAVALLPAELRAQGENSATPSRLPEESDTPAVSSAPKGIAVVELFTSQGCNSCPPADQTLRQIDAVAKRNGLPVHVLSFHVDYWNRLGWTDPYSSTSSSRRQRAYATAKKSNRVYTPQMIVNGTTEFVGSHGAKAEQAITKSLGQKSTVTIDATMSRDPAKQQVNVEYELLGPIQGRVLNVAVVQTPDSNAVPRGENAGRRLSHVNVVRAFQTQPIRQPVGTITLELPDGLDSSALKAIAFVQDPRTLAIVGATSVE